MPNFSSDIHVGFLLVSSFSKHGVPKETIYEHSSLARCFCEGHVFNVLNEH
jgi:hypothetical protein